MKFDPDKPVPPGTRLFLVSVGDTDLAAFVPPGGVLLWARSGSPVTGGETGLAYGDGGVEVPEAEFRKLLAADLAR